MLRCMCDIHVLLFSRNLPQSYAAKRLSSGSQTCVFGISATLLWASKGELLVLFVPLIGLGR